MMSLPLERTAFFIPKFLFPRDADIGLPLLRIIFHSSLCSGLFTLAYRCWFSSSAIDTFLPSIIMNIFFLWAVIIVYVTIAFFVYIGDTFFRIFFCVSQVEFGFV